MYTLKEVGEEFLKEAESYPGLIGILVYQPTANVFEKIIRKNYHALHMSSGRNLLLVAGRSSWNSKYSNQRMRRDFLNTINGEYVMHHMTALSSDGDIFDHSERLIDLKSRFGLNNSDLPCLILLEDVHGNDGYVFPIDRSLINSNNDDLTHLISEVFEICGNIVKDQPCGILPWLARNDNDLQNKIVAWRRKAVADARFKLQTLRLFNGVRKLAPAAGGAALRALSGLSGK